MFIMCGIDTTLGGIPLANYILNRELLLSLITKRNWSIRKTAKQMGIEHTYLAKVIKGCQEPGKLFIDRALITFDLRFEELFSLDNNVDYMQHSHVKTP